MGSQIPNDVLYERQRLSDILQGIHDTILMLNLEKDKIQMFYGYYDQHGGIFSGISNLRNNLYILQETIDKLRKEGK